MAPLPDSNTNRLLVQYRVNGTDVHTAMFRFQSGVTANEARDAVIVALLDNTDAFYTDTVFESARYAAEGSEISFPVSWTPIPGIATTGGRPVDFRARFISMMGRDVTGRQWRLSLFGVVLAVDANFLILDSESAALVALRTSLTDGEPSVTSIEGLPVVPLNYFTSRVSAYWQRRIARNG